jgi:dUTP pyrophosphatase
MASNVKYVDFTLESGAQAPYKKYVGDAGWDLFVNEDTDIMPGETKDIHTGVRMKMPGGIFARITGRSSTMRKHGLLVSEGIIDNGYTGELFVAIHNLNSEVFHVKQGMRLAQVIFQKIEDIRWCKVDGIQMSVFDRNEDGFGSTGV